jgi:hypothetical protein
MVNWHLGIRTRWRVSSDTRPLKGQQGTGWKDFVGILIEFPSTSPFPLFVLSSFFSFLLSPLPPLLFSAPSSLFPPLFYALTSPSPLFSLSLLVSLLNFSHFFSNMSSTSRQAISNKPQLNLSRRNLKPQVKPISRTIKTPLSQFNSQPILSSLPINHDSSHPIDS